MKVEIFDANNKLNFEKKINSFLEKGNTISKVKFESHNEKIRLIVYYDTDLLIKQKAIIIRSVSGIKGSISSINHELKEIANGESICMDTVLFNVNGLMAILIKNI